MPHKFRDIFQKTYVVILMSKWNEILKINWLRDDNVFIESFTIKEALELLRKRAVELEGQDGYDEINEAISMQLEVVKILEGRK